MKIFLKTMLLVLLLIGAYCGLLMLTAQRAQARPTDGSADSTFQVAVVNTVRPASVIVMVKTANQKPLIVLINDSHGVTLANEWIGKKPGSYRLKLNLTELADGTYTVIVQNGETMMTYPVTLSTTKLKRSVRVG